jgi:hypothetical protein
MKRTRIVLALFAALVALPLIAEAIQIQRAQIGITIIVNATPNPLGFLPHPPADSASGIVARATLEGAPKPIEEAFERAQQLHFVAQPSALGGPQVIAQAAKQGAVRVEASIAPNPTATLLYSDQSAVVLNAEAGIATHFTCVYHVTVDTTISSWTLKHGLDADFNNGSGVTFPGIDVGNNSYAGATPNPTATPFTVYADNGGTWYVLAASSGAKTYCVDIVVDMPITTAQGTYSSNAIYTLYY